MSDGQENIAPLDQAIRAAVRAHYAGQEDPDTVDVPADEVIIALITFAVDIGMSAPPGDARRWFMQFIRAVMRAAETSATQGIPIGVALSQIYGEQLH